MSRPPQHGHRANRVSGSLPACLALVLALLAGQDVSAAAAAAPPAEALAQAIEAYRSRDFPRALAQLGDLASEGDPRAQTIVGIMYESGEGVPRNPATAASWYRLAAEQGYDPAQYSLANLYRTGRGVVRDEEEAAFWYAAAAQQGNQWAAARLAELPGGEVYVEPRPVIERGARQSGVAPVRTGIAADRLDSLVARLPSLREARRAAAAADSPPPGTSAGPPGGASSDAARAALDAQPGRGVGAVADEPAATAPPPSARQSPERSSEQSPGRLPRQSPAQSPAQPPGQSEASAGALPAATPGGDYAVQVASTRSRERTEREVERVARAVRDVIPGAGASVVKVDLGETAGVWYRAHLGRFESVAAAQAACAAIVSQAQTQGCFAVTAR